MSSPPESPWGVFLEADQLVFLLQVEPCELKANLRPGPLSSPPS